MAKLMTNYFIHVITGLFFTSACLSGQEKQSPLPPVPPNDSSKVTIRGQTPFDVSPEELVAFVRKRNRGPHHEELETIAQLYYEYGEKKEGGDFVRGAPYRWDWAFFQMIHETGWCTSDKAKKKHNFAGIGAATQDDKGNAAPGDTFSGVADGVKSHLQHLAVYAGQTFDDKSELVAPRTREVYSFRRGVAKTFSDLSGTWCTWPDKGRLYGFNIASIAQEYGTRYQGNLAPEFTAEFQRGVVAMKDRLMKSEFRAINDMILITRPHKGEVRFVSSTSSREQLQPVVISLVMKTKPVQGQPGIDLDMKLHFDTGAIKAKFNPNGMIEGQVKMIPKGNAKVDLFGTGESSATRTEQPMVMWRLEPTSNPGKYVLLFLEQKKETSQYKPMFLLTHNP